MCLENPLVSVIVPTYNRADMIGDTLQSVLDQTYSYFEILVVDDGSTDHTEEAVRAFQDARVLYFKRPHAGLPAAPRNFGIQTARGKYLAFLDSDDLWLSEKLACQVGYLEKHSDVGLLYAQCLGFVEKDRDMGQPFPEIGMAKSGWIYDDLILSDNYIPCLTVMIRRNILDQAGLFNETIRLRAVEDFDLWLRISRLAQVDFYPDVLARYRVHAQGISNAVVKLLENRLYLLNTHEMSGYVERKTTKEIRFQIYLRLALASVHVASSWRGLVINLKLALFNCPSVPLLVKILWPVVVRRFRNVWFTAK